MNLRELVWRDNGIGLMTTADLKLIADLTEWVSSSWIRFFLPKRLKKQRLALRMIGATLNRTPEQKIPFKEQIRLAMEQAKNE